MAMGDRVPRRSVGAPFYAPPRRKTSAEIISEARAAIFDEMSGTSSGSSVGGLRSLRTRRPFTPREPQRTLFTDRARKRDPRPPSAFDLKYLSLTEDNEGPPITSKRIASFAEEEASPEHKTDNKHTTKKDNSMKDGITWSGFTKLPHLSGRSKPLHRRNTTGQITVEAHGDTAASKRRTFGIIKSVSCDGSGIGDIPVRHLALQLPNTSYDNYESMTTLELAEALTTQSSHDVEKTLLLLEPLQNILEKSTPSNNLRELVIRSLYVHIDNEDERILVAIARAMLTMRVTGKHLAAACKLVFKIARNDKNDHFFRNSNLLELLVEGCGRADPLAESECCVYGAGALRFLALEPRLCVLAHEAGALHLAALHLKIFNNAKAERPRQVREQATHALYQLTGALRNLANGGAKTATAFVNSGALGELLAALPLHTDRDVLTNVARCLSVLSAEDACCEWLCTSPCSARALLRTLAACASRAALAVRLTYTLGNMAAADEQARINIYNEEGGIDVILTILESYTRRKDRDTKDLEEDTDLHLVGSDLGGSDGSNEDVLIKTVRVVANLCLSDLAGRGIAMHHAQRTIRALLACLDVAEKAPDKLVSETEEINDGSWNMDRREELATAALATLNNITFYLEPTENLDPLDDHIEQLCKATCRWLHKAGDACRLSACEAVRALGNLSRSSRAARWLVLEGALDALPPFQEHEDASVRYAAAGVLVNVCGSGAEPGAAAGAAAAALRAAASSRDAPAAALLARALWNSHAHRPLPPAHAHLITAALAAFIDDDSVFTACAAPRSDDCDPDIKRHHAKFGELDNQRLHIEDPKQRKAEPDDHHGSGDEDWDRTGYSGEDLGFEEGDITIEDECGCEPCRRLAAWDELVGVAIPLLEKLKPPRADASVGTE
ncbi:PREDICTED: armadillo repeat-containing protein 2 isoform X2 [Papilio polytes]|uniref:armadillo repeat-containing protein 2 isoform X2 n=1 Tax=Papilio polytes TaxID=76194 RepID=UPI0006764418|nr:PREDICTED: armadillo repeat-containing protein 2 isoform X2 [Papilio polytes]